MLSKKCKLFIILFLILTKSYSIDFENPDYDFGVVSRKQKLNHQFHFVNNDTNPVLLKEIVPSCGCTAVEFAPGIYKSGDSGSITIDYTTHISEGRFYKDIDVIIEKNDSTIHKEISISGKTRKNINWQPSVINLDTFPLLDTMSILLNIAWSRKELFTPTLESIPPYLELADSLMISSEDDIQRLIIPIKLSSDTPSKYFKDSIVIITGSEYWPRISIPVEGQIRDSITLFPSSYIDIGTTQQATVLIHSINIESVMPIDSIEIISPLIRKYKVTKRNNKHTQLRLSIQTDSLPAGEINGIKIPLTIFSDTSKHVKSLFLSGKKKSDK